MMRVLILIAFCLGCSSAFRPMFCDELEGKGCKPGANKESCRTINGGEKTCKKSRCNDKREWEDVDPQRAAQIKRARAAFDSIFGKELMKKLCDGKCIPGGTLKNCTTVNGEEKCVNKVCNENEEYVEVTPAPGEGVTPAPGEEVIPAPADEVTSAPGEGVIPAPADEVTSAPGEGVIPAPDDEVAPAPADEVAPAAARRAMDSQSLLEKLMNSVQE